jgi:hypothetical protein
MSHGLVIPLFVAVLIQCVARAQSASLLDGLQRSLLASPSSPLDSTSPVNVAAFSSPSPVNDYQRLVELQYAAAVLDERNRRRTKSPVVGTVPFPFEDVVSSVSTVHDKDEEVTVHKHLSNFSKISSSLSLIEREISRLAPFPLNFVFKWWSFFRGFPLKASTLSFDESLAKSSLNKNALTSFVDDRVYRVGADLLPFPMKFLADFTKYHGLGETKVKNKLIDAYDDARIDVEEADRRVAALVSPWLPYPHNKLVFLVAPFRSYQKLQSLNEEHHGRKFDIDGDVTAVGEWKRALEAVEKEGKAEEEGERRGRGLLGLFGLSPLQFFPMLTPLNLFGKSFNSSGPRPISLQIFLPENRTLNFNAGQQLPQTGE